MMKIISNKYLQIQFFDLKPERVVAGLCLANGENYFFFDIGWDETSLKPYHEIGKLVKEEKGKWTFKQAIGQVMIITELKETDEMWDEALRWLNWTKDWPDMKEKEMIGLINSYEDIPKDKLEIVWVMENKKRGMEHMEPIASKNAYYVKLGRNGMWEESSIKKSILRVGWSQQTLPDINNGRWNIIQKQLEKEISDKGTVTRDCRALRILCESTAEDIWITFHSSRLWWCRVGAPRIFEDKTSKYRKVNGWCSEDIFGTSLLINQIPGRIAKLQGFKGTICRVKEVDELTRLVNRQYSPEFVAIRHSKDDLCRHIEEGLRNLHWKDFETLVDLLFRASGWRRISVLGENMKYSDIELEEPINGEMYQVQVKSVASIRDFQEYSKKFSTDKYRKLFFVVHTPDRKLMEMPVQNEDSIQLVLPKRLAEMVVDLGMLGWLLNKIR